MDTTTLAQQERSEVELVLQSGIFTKAPRLGKFFLHICERHLEGNADQIKEYSIAIEALGRSPDFDPKKDSIVRVEAHRLRKRLEEYYSGPGASHSIQITIPNGQYRPLFLSRDELIASTPPAVNGNAPDPPATSPTVPDTVPQHGPSRHSWRRYGLVFLLVCIVAALSNWIRVRATSKSPAKPAEETWAGPSSEPVPSEYRMMAGYHGPPFADDQGHIWGPDAYYKGGTSTPLPAGRSIESSPDAHFLKAQRSGRFRYDIPLRQGTYELHLYFAETEYGRTNPKGGGDGSRMFQVSINNIVVVRQLDPLAEAGAPNRLHERVFNDISPAKDGKLHLGFEMVVGPAFLNALAILPSSPGRVHPLRLVTQPNPVTDSDGRVWAADEYYCGGTHVSRRNVVLNGKDKALYQGERYGNFFYHLPLPPGKYRLTLHFAETYFGTPESNAPANDSRIFNVFVNGEALLKNYQIAQDAGGPNRTIAKTFDNLEPNAQGVLAIEFVPVRNYAEVNAIEVVQED